MVGVAEPEHVAGEVPLARDPGAGLLGPDGEEPLVAEHADDFDRGHHAVAAGHPAPRGGGEDRRGGSGGAGRRRGCGRSRSVRCSWVVSVVAGEGGL